MIAVHCKEPPEAGVLFPFLRESSEGTEDDIDSGSIDDFANFQQVTASLTAPMMPSK
jgi:hypothetical protein